MEIYSSKPRPDTANEHGESALGRATHSRRTAQARVSSCAVECRQIHGQAAWAAKPRMVHLSAQSCAEHCSHGLVRCPNDWLQTALCLRRRSAKPQRTRLDQRHGTSDRRMDRASNNGGIPLEAPRYMIRDRDCIYGAVVTRRLRAWASGT